MPTVVGLSIVQAEVDLKSLGLMSKVYSYGWKVTAQSPQPGTLLKPGSTVNLTITPVTLITRTGFDQYGHDALLTQEPAFTVPVDALFRENYSGVTDASSSCVGAFCSAELGSSVYQGSYGNSADYVGGFFESWSPGQNSTGNTPTYSGSGVHTWSVTAQDASWTVSVVLYWSGSY